MNTDKESCPWERRTPVRLFIVRAACRRFFPIMLLHWLESVVELFY